MNSPGGYVYILYGDDTFGRDEAVQSLKDRMRALPAGEHNLTELGPETTVTALRMAADVVPFLADRRMVIVYGHDPGRLQPRWRADQHADARRWRPTRADEYQVLLEYLPELPQTTSLVLVEDARLTPEPLVAAIPRTFGGTRPTHRSRTSRTGCAVEQRRSAWSSTRRPYASWPASAAPTCAAWTASCASSATTLPAAR